MSTGPPPPNPTHIDLSDEHLSDLSDSNLSDHSSTEDTINDESQDVESLRRANEKLKRKLQRIEAKKKKKKQDKMRKKEEKKQLDQKTINLNIIKAQSETLDMIKPILQHFPPPKYEGVAKLISDFLLLNDGHILFSRTWLKNDTTVLSTPLLFRPVYIIILHEILKFIEHFFKSGTPIGRPGHAFYIAGDQGIGKTSLMLILMSILSLRSIDFHYEKGFKDGKRQDFRPSQIGEKTFSFDELVGTDRSSLNEILIHIHDDCPPPEDIQDNHLHFIFTSPDPKRLPPPEKKDDTSPNDQPIPIPSSDAKILPPEKQPQPSTTQTQAQASSSPEPSSNHPCHIFRLPTFSLAEDAVAMVGCTPTVPFTVLSPEDMQLRKKDQETLLSIEMDKDEIAGRLPRAFVDNILSSKNSTVAKELKNLVGDERVSLTQWKKFCSKIEEEIASRAVTVEAKPKPSQKSTEIGGKGKRSKHPSKNTPTRDISQTEYAQIVARQQEEDIRQAFLEFKREEEEKKRKEEEEEKRKKEADLNIVVTPPISHIAQGSSVNMKQSQQEWEEYRDRFEQAPQKRKEEAKGKEEEEGKQEEVIEADLHIIAAQSQTIHLIKPARIEPLSEEDTVDEDTNQKRKEDKKIDRFYTSLNKRIQNQKEIPDRERIIAVVNWLMNQLKVHSKRSKEQAEFIKGLIRKLVLFEWDQSEQQDQDAQNAEATTTAQNTQNEGGEDEQMAEKIITPEVKNGEEVEGKGTDTEKAEAAPTGKNAQEEKGNDTDVEKPKTAEEHERERQRVITEKLFEIAKSYDLPSPDIVREIQEFSVLIEKVKIANPQTSPSPKDLTDLTAQLVRLKTLIEGPNVSEAANRQNVRDAVTSVSKQDRLKDKKRRTLLFSTLIDMLITPPPYDSRKKVLQSLFVHPAEDVKTTDICLRYHLNFLLTQSRRLQSNNQALDFIVTQLIEYIRYSQMKANPKISAPIKLAFNKTKMASIACDFLMMIMNPPIAPVDPAHERARHSLNPMDPPHIQVEQRLEYVQNQIEQVQVELSLVSLMDEFYFIAQDINILVTPHSILRGLSERQEKPELDLIRERVVVYYGNLRDDGLRGWIENAIRTLLPLIDTAGALEAVMSAIQDNLNTIITQFNEKNPSECSVINRQWLAIVRSVMNTILYLIDAGTPRCEILEKYKGLRQLLTTVYLSNQDHILRVADQQLNQNCEEPKSDYVNDLTVFFAHFGTSESQAPGGGDSREMSLDLDLESLRTIELPRTLQLAPVSQDRLERMSIALFARNLLCFLQLETGFPFDEPCYLTEFYTEFLQKWNPGDIVHRSFVDFMNATNLLSQKNFRVTPDKFTDFLEKEHPTLKTDPTPLQKLREKSHLKSMMTERITLQVADPEQPFKNFLTRQFGVHFLLWASTDLLMKAADAIPSPKPRTETTHSQDEARPSQESGDERTVGMLNVARASIFGPSPRWLTSTDARTNRGLVFLWDGVLNSESAKALTEVADSNHSRIMEFNTPLIFFEKTLNAAWDDISSLVPLLREYRTKEKRPSLLRSVFSLIFKKIAEAIEQMERQILFVPVSPFVEQIMQSEVVAAIARLMNQTDYNTFKNNQTSHRFQMPPNVEEPLVCISFLLNCPTPIYFSTTTTKFTSKHTCVSSQQSIFWSRRPQFETTATKVTSMPMLTFPQLSNKSVEGTKFPQSHIPTERGKTDFYAEDLQEVTGGNLPGLDALIVSRGTDAACETIFMAIQATSSKTHSLAVDGITLMQQLLFQAMCHLEPSEEIVAIYNYATTQEEFTFPSRTGILGFHMVSSHLKFDDNTLAHMSSMLRRRDRPLVSNPFESQPTMTTSFITNTLLANLPRYPTFSKAFDPWKTTLLNMKILTDPSFILPYRWKLLCDVLQDSSPALFEQDGMVRKTIQEMLRIGLSPNDLGESVEDRIKTFKSFLLYIAISCRRKKLLHPNTGEDDFDFVNLVKSIIGTDTSPAFQTILTSLTGQASTMDQSMRDEQLKQLDSLYRENRIQMRLYPVYRVMTNNAMKRLRNPTQECLSVIQSEKDGGVFRVPTRNNLSAILHCGTVLLDNIPPLSPTTPDSLPQSKTLKIPVHSFVLAKHGFSDSIPSLCELKQNDVENEVTNVTPSPLIRWLPHRVVIDPSLFPKTQPQEESLSFFTTFIHCLFNNPFIPVTTSFTTDLLNRNRDDKSLLVHLQTIIPKLDSFLSELKLKDIAVKKAADKPEGPEIEKDSGSQDDTDRHEVKEADDKPEGPEIEKVGGSQKTSNKPKKEKYKGLQTILDKLSDILKEEQASSVLSELPELRSSPRKFKLNRVQRDIVNPDIEAIESIEAIRQQPTLVFMKSGSDFLAPSTKEPKFVVDLKTEAHLFPIPFSTGYKEGELREEMKQIYEPLTQLLPEHFPKEHVSHSPPPHLPLSHSPPSLSPPPHLPLSHSPPSLSPLSLSLLSVEAEGNREQHEISSSKEEAESIARAIEDSEILRIGETSTTPLFVFIVDEDLPDHESLPMSLHSANGNVDCGVMRQRSLADILWILFLTRISREVMALSLNTSLKPKDFTEYVLPFISQVLMDEFYRQKVKIILPNIFQAIISLVEAEGLDNLNEHPSIGIELLVSSYLHMKDEAAVFSLSRLLMMCKSKPNGETRLDTLINNASPTNELDLLTRWFKLLYSNVKEFGFDVAIKSYGFTTATIRSNLLTAFYLIIELKRKDQQPLVTQLLATITFILNAGTQQFFDERDRPTLHDLQELAVKCSQSLTNIKDPRRITIANLSLMIATILGPSPRPKPNPQERN
ncbi:hypothetical protein BLNAU_21079 [Blattamonas nauphoetae]|uniref:Uncharacterized protein n=1 Tax=Blattamonas nauphoetae TaxID=2049346 RepID=A0ABQ9X117_9EUKA|nr:hypothetical protein BLNAU_21079 [Blattamonas nauphoetae]